MIASSPSKRSDLFIKDFLNYLIVEKNCSQNTIESYGYDLSKFKLFFLNQGVADISKIKREEVIRFILGLKEEGYAHKSVYRVLSCLKSFYRFMYRERYVERNPLFDVESPKMHEKIPLILNEEEVVSMLDLPAVTESEIRNTAILEFLYATGCRVSELINVSIQDLSIKHLLVKLKGKGSKERIIPLHRNCAYAIRRWLKFRTKRKPETPLFLSKKGEKLKRHDIWKIIKNMGKKAGIVKNIYPHTFRHCYATHLMNHGADIRMIQELLGHSNITSTQIYLQMNLEDLQKKFELFHPCNVHKKKKPDSPTS